MEPEGLKTWIRFWQEAWANDRKAMQLLAAAGCILISASIGHFYARETWTLGWQLWAWLMSVVTIAFLLMPSRAPRLALGKTWRLLLVLVVVALLLRAPYLGRVPGGFHVDEARVADFALRHVYPQPQWTVNPFHTGYASQPTLHHYIIRLTIALAGHSIAASRISSVVVGTLSVLVTYALISILQDRRTAFLTAILMTTYHLHIHWSRLSLNNIWDALWVPAMLAAYAWGWKQRWSGGAVLAGLSLGFSQYFYAGNKIGVFLILYLMVALWRQERDTRRLTVFAGKMLLTAICVALPLFLFALHNPDTYFERTRIVVGWQHSAIAEVTGEPLDLFAYAVYQAKRSFGAFTLFPEITGFYGPNVPLLIGLAQPLFVVGILWGLYKRSYVPLVWLLLGVLLGGIMMTGAPSSPRYVVSTPAICWTIAMSLAWLTEKGGWRRTLALTFLAIILISDLVFYFASYVPSIPEDLFHPFPEI